MSSPTWDVLDIESGDEGWDADIKDNFSNLHHLIFDCPFPIKIYPDEATLSSEAPPGLYEHSLAVVQDTGTPSLYLLEISTGIDWRRIPTQAPAVPDGSSVNTLLASLRSTGVIAT